MLGEAMIITNFIQMAKLYVIQFAQEYTLPVLCSLVYIHTRQYYTLGLSELSKMFGVVTINVQPTDM